MFFNLRETLIASLILLVSGSIFLFNFFQLRQQIQDGGVIVSGIREGKTLFSLAQGTDCFGQLSFETMDGRLMGLKTSLKLDVLIGEETETVDVFGESYFNPLGQLVASKTRLAFREQRSFLETEGVNPIFVRLSGNFEGREVKHRTQVPGPVELLLSEDDQTFRLVYSQLSHLASMAPTPQLTSLSSLPAFDVSVEPGQICEQVTALNLNPILFLIQKLNGNYGRNWSSY